MLRPFTKNPMEGLHHHLPCPSAIVCSCGHQFDSSADGGGALWLYLAHTTSAAIALSSSTINKPHRIAHTLINCILCSQSIDVDHYRTHLAAECQGERAAIARYRQSNRSECGGGGGGGGGASFECDECLFNDRFHRFDVGTMLEHRHVGSDRPLAFELYVTCRACADCCVPVDSAFGHAAFMHRERLSTETDVADLFYTAPKMRPISACFDSTTNPSVSRGHFAPIPIGAGNRTDSMIAHPNRIPNPAFASNRRWNDRRLALTSHRRHESPLIRQGLVRFSNAACMPSAESLVKQQSLAEVDYASADYRYLAEEIFSEQLVNALCDIGETSHAPRQEETFIGSGSCPPDDGEAPTAEPLRSRIRFCSQTGLQNATKKSLRACVDSSTRRERIGSGECRTFVSRRQHAESGSHRPDGESLECDECGEKFSTHKRAIIHQRRHSGQPWFGGKPEHECDECGKRYADDSSLRRHQKSHAGESLSRGRWQHECDECGKCYTQNSNLRRHKHSHTGESLTRGRRLYECEECGKICGQSSNLQLHRRTHTNERPFACAQCDKCFSQLSLLQQHQRSHTGERPFACSDCGKRFKIYGNIVRHRRLHTGVRPFSCEICHSGFYTRAELVSHKGSKRPRGHPRKTST